jgi:hypothetical protein
MNEFLDSRVRKASSISFVASALSVAPVLASGVEKSVDAVRLDRNSSGRGRTPGGDLPPNGLDDQEEEPRWVSGRDVHSEDSYLHDTSWREKRERSATVTTILLQ